MSGDNDSIVNNPLFGAVIGRQIGNNANADADRIRSETKAEISSNLTDTAIIITQQLRERLDKVNDVARKWEERSDKFEAELNDSKVTIDSLRNQLLNFQDNEVDLYASIAGVRGVTRELLEELRKSDPNNPLLDKKIRDKVYLSSFDNVGKQTLGSTFPQRKEKANYWRDEAFGSVESNRGGPEKSKITPNILVRSEAEVPSHISDREKLLGLVERLTAEVKKNNPSAPILQDKVMLDVFADFTLNEMERQENHKL